jgi:hypothetical protein
MALNEGAFKTHNQSNKEIMKKFIHSVLIVCAVVVLANGFSNNLLADEQVNDSPTSTETKPKRPYPFRGKISAIDKEARSITLQGKEKSRTFYFTAETKVQKHGKSAKLDDAVVGDEVAGTVLADANGRLVLRTVRFGPKPDSDKDVSTAKKGE